MRRLASWTLFMAVVVGLVAAVGEPAPLSVDVFVEGTPVTLEAPATVGGALEVAGVTPRDGVLRSVVSDSVLDRDWDPAVLLLDGVPTGHDELLLPDQHVTVVHGVDAIEETVRSEVVVAHTRPDVEREMWSAGSDGLDEVVEGAISGEVVSRTPLLAPEPARPVPGPFVTLTFDDGPHPEFTPLVLEILREAEAQAMFCVLGTQVRRHPELVQAIHDEGHLLCNHTMDHPVLVGMSEEAVDAEIAETSALITEITGEAPAFFRAPYGEVDATVVETVRRHGMRVIGWSVDSDDWRGPTTEEFLHSVVVTTHPGAVLLFHDGGGDRTLTVATLPDILHALDFSGYVFATPPT